MYINSQDKSNKFETLKWERVKKKYKMLENETNSYKSEFWNKNLNLEKKKNLILLRIIKNLILDKFKKSNKLVF